MSTKPNKPSVQLSTVTVSAFFQVSIPVVVLTIDGIFSLKFEDVSFMLYENPTTGRLGRSTNGDNDSDIKEEVVLRVQGILCEKSLPPVQRR